MLAKLALSFMFGVCAIVVMVMPTLFVASLAAGTTLLSVLYLGAYVAAYVGSFVAAILWRAGK